MNIDIKEFIEKFKESKDWSHLQVAAEKMVHLFDDEIKELFDENKETSKRVCLPCYV